MIKSELVQRLSAKCPHLYQRDVERIVNIVLGEIVEAFRNGDRVELRGFGTFTAKERIARTGRDPRTGAAVEVAAKKAPAFKPGKEMRKRLNKPDSRTSPIGSQHNPKSRGSPSMLIKTQVVRSKSELLKELQRLPVTKSVIYRNVARRAW